jgi:hypothetical protein
MLMRLCIPPSSRSTMSFVPMLMRLCILGYVAVMVSGHAALIIPTTRNAMDRRLPEFAGGASPSTTCTCGNNFNGACDVGRARAEGGGGQPCLWWSQGCSIGCEYCLTDPKHPWNNGTIPTKPIVGAAPHADKAGFRTSYCENPTSKAVLPKQFWTMNTHAVDGKAVVCHMPWYSLHSTCVT